MRTVENPDITFYTYPVFKCCNFCLETIIPTLFLKVSSLVSACINPNPSSVVVQSNYCVHSTILCSLVSFEPSKYDNVISNTKTIIKIYKYVKYCTKEMSFLDKIVIFFTDVLVTI